MSVTVLHGDNRELILTLPECSIDSVVTDPPYALVSIVKRFGADDAAPAKSNGATGVYRRAAAGFMGQRWDNGETAFDPDFWRQVCRVLKPGGHVLAFGGTRTYHRLACAIEDAGFEIRDMVAWLYGSGFPKSHDVSKGIDKAAGVEREVVGQTDGGLHRGSGSTVGSFTGLHAVTSPATVDAIRWNGWGTALKPALEPIVLARKPLIGTVAENVLAHGTGALNINACRVSAGARRADDSNGGNGHLRTNGQRTSTENIEHRQTFAVQHDAHDHRSSNASGCVLDDQQSPDLQDDYRLSFHSYGGLPHSDAENGQASVRQPIDGLGPPGPDAIEPDSHDHLSTFRKDTTPHIEGQGRWPANVIHDGSDEVVAGFPEAPGQQRVVTGDERSHRTLNAYGDFGATRNGFEPRGDEGSAARYFYTAKADETDRVASRHPTVKPVDLMQYLCRLVTPPGGCVLDPFAGSGTTGEAAVREGFRAVLIEREAEYVSDIKRRMELAMAGPEEKQRAIIKAKGKVESVDELPLFGGPMQ